MRSAIVLILLLLAVGCQKSTKDSDSTKTQSARDKSLASEMHTSTNDSDLSDTSTANYNLNSTETGAAEAQPVLLKAPFSKEEAEAARDSWAKAKGIDAEFTNSIGMKFNFIPPGKFKMGSPESELERTESEFQHEVEISQPLFMGVFEVTQQEYEKVMGENPALISGKGDGKEDVAAMDTRQFPVEQVSWDDAQSFVKALNAKEGQSGRRFRLPTEAEWEYACRAGSETPFSFGSRLNGDRANCDGNNPYGTTTKGTDLGRTARVGSYTANSFGLFDMHGNVYEWCQDKYESNYYKNSPLVDPPGPDTGSSRVLRGGSWLSGALYCRSAYRIYYDPSHGYNCKFGFRVVCELE